GMDWTVRPGLSQPRDASGVCGPPPPVTPITAPVVFVNSNSWAGPPNPPPNLSGKVAVIDRGLYGISDAMLAYGAQTNGALAAVLINQPANGFPFKVGSNPPAPVTIPVLCVIV